MKEFFSSIPLYTMKKPFLSFPSFDEEENAIDHKKFYFLMDGEKNKKDNIYTLSTGLKLWNKKLKNEKFDRIKQTLDNVMFPDIINNSNKERQNTINEKQLTPKKAYGIKKNNKDKFLKNLRLKFSHENSNLINEAVFPKNNMKFIFKNSILENAFLPSGCNFRDINKHFLKNSNIHNPNNDDCSNINDKKNITKIKLIKTSSSTNLINTFFDVRSSKINKRDDNINGVNFDLKKYTILNKNEMKKSETNMEKISPCLNTKEEETSHTDTSQDDIGKIGLFGSIFQKPFNENKSASQDKIDFNSEYNNIFNTNNLDLHNNNPSISIKQKDIEFQIIRKIKIPAHEFFKKSLKAKKSSSTKKIKIFNNNNS